MSTIANILNEVTRSDRMDDEMRQASQQLAPYWEKIHEGFSRQFADDMDRANENLWLLRCQEHFDRGLWLGLRLGQFSEQGPGGGVGDP